MAAGLREAELAGLVAGRRRLVRDAGTELRRRQQRVRVGDQEGGDRGHTGEGKARDCRAALVRRSAGPLEGRREEHQEHDARRVLGRACEAEAHPGDQPVAPPAMGEHARAAPEREAERREHRHVVERQVRVEHGQERDREQRACEQAGAAVEEPPREQVREVHGERAQQRGDDARDHEHLGRVERVRVRRVRPAAVAEPVDDVQQVRVGRRVDEVVGIPRVAEQAERLRDEVGVLVCVEREREPVLGAPEAQHQGAGEKRRQREAIRVATLPQATYAE